MEINKDLYKSKKQSGGVRQTKKLRRHEETREQRIYEILVN